MYGQIYWNYNVVPMHLPASFVGLHCAQVLLSTEDVHADPFGCVGGWAVLLVLAEVFVDFSWWKCVVRGVGGTLRQASANSCVY